MGLRAPSLADMDSFEVSRKRKPVKLSNATNMRSVNVIMWRVDGSAVVAAHPRRSPDCCTNALWRRMMCARNMCRIKAHNSRGTDDADSEDLDHNFLEIGEPHKARVMTDVGSKLQTAFNMRRWPQGWI